MRNIRDWIKKKSYDWIKNLKDWTKVIKALEWKLKDCT